MKCRRCGTELRSDDEFCYHCGERTTVIQRMVASRMFAGSIVALVLVAAVAVVAYLILTDRLALPFLGGNQTKSEVISEDSENEPEPESEVTAAAPTDTPEPTATPYVFVPSDVTSEVKSAVKPLLSEVKPFLAFSASFYADGSHRFKWDDVSATTMALYKLQYVDGKVKYGDSFSSIKKKVKKEMQNLFAKAYKFDMTYSGTFPDYVYVRSGDTVVYNAIGISGKSYRMELQKILAYKENKYRVIVKACLVNQTTKEEGASQKYTLWIQDNDTSEYGYTIDKIRLYKKEDKKLPK